MLSVSVGWIAFSTAVILVGGGGVVLVVSRTGLHEQLQCCCSSSATVSCLDWCPRYPPPLTQAVCKCGDRLFLAADATAAVAECCGDFAAFLVSTVFGSCDRPRLPYSRPVCNTGVLAVLLHGCDGGGLRFGAATTRYHTYSVSTWWTAVPVIAVAPRPPAINFEVFSAPEGVISYQGHSRWASPIPSRQDALRLQSDMHVRMSPTPLVMGVPSYRN